MEIDKTTLNDLSIFNHEEELSVFSKLNFTKTVGGKERLRKVFNNSLPNIEAILEVQKIVQLIIDKIEDWPDSIGNGSILMIHKFYEAVIDQPPPNPSVLSTKYYQFFHRADYSLVKYSVGHSFNFIKGMHQLIAVFLKEDTPKKLKTILETIQSKLEKRSLQIVTKREIKEDLSPTEILALGYYLRYHYKHDLFELIEYYFQLDAWYGMAKATKELKLVFPTFKNSTAPLNNSSINMSHFLPSETFKMVFLIRCTSL
jgi:DNA mismatch repair ATPase MutS